MDPRHGSSGDFAEFMQLANGLGLRVIIDLVVNHTSDQHPWFQETLTGGGCEAPRLVRMV